MPSICHCGPTGNGPRMNNIINVSMVAEEQKEEGARQGQICGLARETDGPWPAPFPCGDALVVG